MKDIRPLLLAFATVLAALPAAAQGQPPDRLQQILDRGALRVGTTMDTPVFSMRDRASGQLRGFDMDALETLAPALGVKIEYVKMNFGSMLADLAADRFDIAMSGHGPHARARAGRDVLQAVHALRQVADDPQHRPGALQVAPGSRPSRHQDRLQPGRTE
jgi:ABC-type amino acid transport substrate-binding protein